jgi:WhiB family redox-sensing transcriptional regulator
VNWIHNAACRGQPPDLFHPIGAGDNCPEAQRICQACPVIAECLQDALTQRDVFGYRGGLSGEARRHMLAARGKRDITAEVLRLHAKRWHPKAIALALNVDNAIVYRIVKAHRESGQVVA